MKPDATIDLSQILRGLFAVAVVFWHTLGSANQGAIPAALNVPGRVSVWVFFGLSGYVIAHGFLSGRYGFDWPDLRTFYQRRGARILPLFWLCTALVLTAGLWLPVEFEYAPWNIVQTMLALQWHHTSDPVGVFWTLGIELQFYLVAPFICWAIMASGSLGRWLTASGVVVALWQFGAVSDDRSMLANIHFFLVGVLMASTVLSGDADPACRHPISAWAWGAVGALGIAAASSSYSGAFWTYRGATFTIVAIMGFMMAHRSIELQSRPLGHVSRPLMRLGLLAYGLYAWHGVLLVLVPWFNGQFFALVTVSTLLAAASYRWIERPIINWSHTFRIAPVVT